MTTTRPTFITYPFRCAATTRPISCSAAFPSSSSPTSKSNAKPMPSTPSRTPNPTVATPQNILSPTTRKAHVLTSSEAHLKYAAQLLTQGKLVSFPTETVYGLGADATNDQAVQNIFKAKNRPSDNPLIVHVSNIDDLYNYDLVQLPLSHLVLKLASHYWPGPLTLILPISSSNKKLSKYVTANLNSIAIRIPSHPIANKLLTYSNLPIAAPSANLSGRPSPTDFNHVFNDLSTKIDAIIDNDNCLIDIGLESTVVDLTDVLKPTILRPGIISINDLQQTTGIQFFRPSTSTDANSKIETPKAPGMKYRHYAPIAPLYIIDSQTLNSSIKHWLTKVNRIGILADQSICIKCNNDNDNQNIVTVPCGNQQTASSFGQALYSSLRAFDGEGQLAVTPPVAVILAIPPAGIEEGIGEAVMNRLSKAAAGRQEDVPTK